MISHILLIYLLDSITLCFISQAGFSPCRFPLESDTEPKTDRYTADRPIRSNFGDSHKLLKKKGRSFFQSVCACLQKCGEGDVRETFRHRMLI